MFVIALIPKNWALKILFKKWTLKVRIRFVEYTPHVNSTSAAILTFDSLEIKYCIEIKCYKFPTNSGVISTRTLIFCKQKKRKMENCTTLITTLLISSASLVLYGLVRVVYVVWWRPKSLEKQLRQQGIQGTSFNLLQFHGGDMRKMVKVSKETWSKPMSLNHHIAPYVLPSFHQMVQKYGKQLVHEKTHTKENIFKLK